MHARNFTNVFTRCKVLARVSSNETKSRCTVHHLLAKTYALSTNFYISNRGYIYSLAKTNEKQSYSRGVGSFPFNVITNKKYSLKSSQKSSKMNCLAKAHIQNTETKWFPFVSGSAFCDLQMIPCKQTEARVRTLDNNLVLHFVQ